eukprot:2180250-Pleurochrysis_carterae.AAC.1
MEETVCGIDTSRKGVGGRGKDCGRIRHFSLTFADVELHMDTTSVCLTADPSPNGGVQHVAVEFYATVTNQNERSVVGAQARSATATKSTIQPGRPV